MHEKRPDLRRVSSRMRAIRCCDSAHGRCRTASSACSNHRRPPAASLRKPLRPRQHNMFRPQSIAYPLHRRFRAPLPVVPRNNPYVAERAQTIRSTRAAREYPASRQPNTKLWLGRCHARSLCHQQIARIVCSSFGKDCKLSFPAARCNIPAAPAPSNPCGPRSP